MSQDEPDQEGSRVDVSNLMDSTLSREHAWGYSPQLLEMWAAFSRFYRERGVLRELLLRGPEMGQVSAIAVTAGWGPKATRDESLTTDASETSTGGFLHFLPPFQLDQDMQLAAFRAGMTPWQSAAHAGIDAFADNDPSERRLILTYEHPAEVFVTPAPFDKRSRDLLNLKRFKEQMHLDRYSTDLLLMTGQLPYGSVVDGDDPPDFVGTTAHGDRTIECTQFTLESRRQSHGLFASVQQAVLLAARQSRERFIRLRGCVVYMYFNQSTVLLGPPPRRADTAAMEEIVEALAQYDADPQRLWILDDAEPPDSPDIAAVTTSFGCTLYAVPMAMAAPVTSFFAATGFELGVGVQTVHTREEAWRQIEEIVTRKDKQGTDHLLITVGGPDDRGFAFLSEELVASMGLEGQHPPQTPRHLKSVRMHFWSTGRVVEVLPEVTEITDPAYHGYVRSHLAFRLPEAKPEE